MSIPVRQPHVYPPSRSKPISSYLRASKWVVPTCIQRLEQTLKWRRDYGLYDTINAAHVEPEAVTGKQVLFGYDVTGKPSLYLLPSRQNTTDVVRQVQFTVWSLERTIDLMPPGVECVLSSLFGTVSAW